MAYLSKLRILLYGLNFEPELTGAGKYSGELARWLTTRGHDVQVVTAPPYYPEWRVGAGFSAARYSIDANPMAPHLSVLRCPIWVPGKVTGVRRLLHLLSFAFSSAPALLCMAIRKRPSVLMVVVPTMACAPLALIVAGILRLPIWLHIQDFEVDAMHAMGILPGAKFTQKLVLACEAWLLKRFDRVSSISRKMVDRLLEKGVASDRVVEFPNWVDVSLIHPMDFGAKNINPVRELFCVPEGAIVVLYAGNIGLKQGLEVVVESARRLSDRMDIFFVFVGAGSAMEGLKSSAKDLKQVKWFPLQPIELLNDLLNAADIHVLPQKAGAADLVMPSKLTGMLSSGRVIVGTAEAETELGLVLEKCGVRVPAEDAEALTVAIEQLSQDECKRLQLGASGREYALAHLSHAVIFRQFESELLRLMDNESGVMPDNSCKK